MKPEVICHIMSSVDGRLLSGRWTPPFDGTNPGLLFKTYADAGRTLGADAWMFGKATTREAFPYRFMPKSNLHPQPGTIHVGRREIAGTFITIDPDADIFYNSGTFRGDNMIVALGTNATDDYLALLRDKGISYIILEDPADLAAVMDILHDDFGIARIALRGGGIIDGAMLAAGLIDELSLVIYPGIDGLASAPSIFEYLGGPDAHPAEGQSLELLSVEILGHGVVWLRYRFHKQSR